MIGRRTNGPWRSRLRPLDLLATGTIGMRTRRLRAVLTALGIAIGIASMVSVVGISASSRADLLAEIDRLGTNLLAVQPGTDLFGTASTMSADAPAMIRRIGPVVEATTLSAVDEPVHRSDQVPSSHRNGLSVQATDEHLVDTVGATLASGRAHDRASLQLPTVVLGSVAAQRLGIDEIGGGYRVRIGDEWFAVIGILDPLALHADLNRSVFIGVPAAAEAFGSKGLPSRVLLRTTQSQVEAVRAVLARTASPGAPNEVQVSRPSDALEARAQVDENLQRLLLGLGGVALLVGGIGIANVMVISVLERRSEIGLRRALGATRGHIRAQFVIEAALLSAAGGLLGVSLGSAITALYADRQGWLLDLPVRGLLAGVAAALAIGALAGLYPAVRAARLDPAEAVRPAA